MLMLLNNNFVVRFVVYRIVIMCLIFPPPTEASNSFTPINCYDCQSSSASASSSSLDTYSTYDNNNIETQGRYVGSVVAAPLDEHVSLDHDSRYNTPYDPATSSLLSISSGYSTDLNTNEVKSTSDYETSNYSNQYQLKPADRFHPTTYNGPQNDLRAPGNSLRQVATNGLTGTSAGATFRDPGGGFRGNFGPQLGTQGGGLRGRFPFRLPGGGLRGGLSALLGNLGGLRGNGLGANGLGANGLGGSGPTGAGPGGGGPGGVGPGGVGPGGNGLGLGGFGGSGASFGGNGLGPGGLNGAGLGPGGFGGGNLGAGNFGGNGLEGILGNGGVGGGGFGGGPLGGSGLGGPGGVPGLGGIGGNGFGGNFGGGPLGGPGLGGGGLGGAGFGSAGLGAAGLGGAGLGGSFGNGFFGGQGATGGVVPGNGLFGTLGGGFREAPESAGGGSAGNAVSGLSGSEPLGGSPGVNFPGGTPGSGGFGNGGTGLQSAGSGTIGASGSSQLLGQQVIGEPDSETGVGEVVQPAQADLNTIQNDAAYKPPSSPVNYGYGYPSSIYQQPLPDITEAPAPSPNPTIGEPVIPVNQPTGILQGGGAVTVPQAVVGVSPPIYGYYYIGRKAWYIPLYFCVYFIVYVGCLILKHVYRHKAQYPEHLHEAVITADSRMYADSVQLLAETLLKALEKFNA